MTNNSSSSTKIGYTRKEFGAIFQLYSQNVYRGFFRDFSFADLQGRYYISFREEAGKTPLITIEKQRLGPDRSIFIATSPSGKGEFKEIARSEKLESFIRQLRGKIDILYAGKDTTKTYKNERSNKN